MDSRELSEEEKAERARRFTSQEGDLMVIGPDGQPLTGEDAVALLDERRKLLETYYGKTLEEQYEDRIKENHTGPNKEGPP